MKSKGGLRAELGRTVVEMDGIRRRPQRTQRSLPIEDLLDALTLFVLLAVIGLAMYIVHAEYVGNVDSFVEHAGTFIY